MATEEKTKQKQPTKFTRVTLKRNFYGDSSGKYTMMLIFSGVIIFALLVIASYVIVTEPKSKYFLSNEKGQIFLSTPLHKPLNSIAQIKDWTAQAVVRSINFNFINYEHQISLSKNFYTDKGYNLLLQQIKTLFLKELVTSRFSVKLSLCDVAEISRSKHGIDNSTGTPRYTWYVVLPAYMHFQNNRESTAIVTKIIVKVQRMSDLEYYGGLAIDDIRITEPVALHNRKSNSELPVCKNG